MVGFISEPVKEEDTVATFQPKIKTSVNDPENCKFDFGNFCADVDDFSLASAQSYLDFDVFKDWVEEMQDPGRDAAKEVKIGSRVGVENYSENPVGNCVVDCVNDMKNGVKFGYVKVESCGTDESAENNRDVVVRDDDMVKSCEIRGDCETESGITGPAEICSDGRNGQLNVSRGDEFCIGTLDDRNCGKVGNKDYSTEKGLEKVSLVGNMGGLVVAANGVKETEIASVGDENDSDSDSDSDCETASSSSSSNSERDDDPDEEEEKSCKIKSENTKQEVDMEEGEINGSDSEKMVSWSDNDDDDDDKSDSKDNGTDDMDGQYFEMGEIDDDDDDEGSKGPIKSKNELTVLPPVPPVDVTLQPCHQILPVGIISSILGAQIIVEGSEKHNPLSEGSILWISETRLPLGLVDEIFGPVKTPYYIVRYNSESEVPSAIQDGTLVGFVPEFVDHVLNDKNIYQKGYDASGENDEELFDEVEFSDDEKEAEYKRMSKTSKRGNIDQGPKKKNKNRSNIKNKDKTWTNEQPSASQAPAVLSSQPNLMQHQARNPVPNLSQGNLSGPGPNFPSEPTVFAQQPQPGSFMLNGLWANGVPFQQQNMALFSGFQVNGMPWLQQNPPRAQQMPSVNPTLFHQRQLLSQIPQSNPALYQQPFDISQLVSGNSASPFGQVNFAGRPTLASNFSNQAPFCLPNANVQFPMFPGIQHNEPQVGQSGSGNPQPATSFPMNEEIRSQFNRGFSSGGGRRRNPFHQRGRGGHAEGRRVISPSS